MVRVQPHHVKQGIQDEPVNPSVGVGREGELVRLTSKLFLIGDSKLVFGYLVPVNGVTPQGRTSVGVELLHGHLGEVPEAVQ